MVMFIKTKTLVWKVNQTYFAAKHARTDKLCLKELFPEADNIYYRKVDGLDYNLFIRFRNESDEAEFILRMNNAT